MPKKTHFMSFNMRHCYHFYERDNILSVNHKKYILSAGQKRRAQYRDMNMLIQKRYFTDVRFMNKGKHE